MVRPLVFDSTPLIYFAKVSLSSLLRVLDEPKIITMGVYNELLRGGALGKPEARVLRGLVEEKVITVQDPKDVGFVLRIVKVAAEKERDPLHRTEADILALAKELDGVAISDDHVAKSVARLIGIELHGTGYLLGRMYKAGRMSRDELLGYLGEMRRYGWRASEEEYERILNYLRRT